MGLKEGNKPAFGVEHLQKSRMLIVAGHVSVGHIHTMFHVIFGSS